MRSMCRRNNVHVNGELKRFEKIGTEFIGLQLENPVPILATVPIEQWNRFVSLYPEEKNLSLSGVLNRIENQNIINVVNDNSIGRFHNILGEVETEIKFKGDVKLLRKFPFSTESKLYLMRMVFLTLDSNPTSFEAIAVRSIVPYFEEIKEGTKMELQASLMAEKSDRFQPYWRVTHRPVIIN